MEFSFVSNGNFMPNYKSLDKYILQNF